MNLYYKIWIDAILQQRSKAKEGNNWKLSTLIPISLLMGVNLFTFFYWMKVIFNRNLPLFFTVNIFNAKPLNGYISVIITFIIPFLILNYLLIFSNSRYLELEKNYSAHNGKLYRKYIMVSLGLAIIPIIIQKMFF